MEGANRKNNMIRHPESRKKLQHGMSEQNSMSLLAARVLQLLLRRRGISAQRLTGELRVPTLSSTSELHI